MSLHFFRMNDIPSVTYCMALLYIELHTICAPFHNRIIPVQFKLHRGSTLFSSSSYTSSTGQVYCPKIFITIKIHTHKSSLFFKKARLVTATLLYKFLKDPKPPRTTENEPQEHHGGSSHKPSSYNNTVMKSACVLHCVYASACVCLCFRS